MTERPSRLLAELESAIRSSGHGYEGDCLRADLASQLVRGGRDDEAEAILADLRARYRAAPHERVTPWINFAEATVDLRQGRGDDALIKMRRAHALSVALKLPLAPFAAASLAHMYWNRAEVELAVRHAREALQSAPEDDHRTRFRVNMVVGEILAMSRRESTSQPWFARARAHAMAAKDDASLSALGFNLGVIQFDLLKQGVHEGLIARPSASRADIVTRSSEDLDVALGIRGVYLRTMQSAQLSSMKGEYQLALSIYESLGESVRIASSQRLKASWLADEAWCLCNVGRTSEAGEIAKRAIQSLSPDTQIDDRAVVHSLLALVYAALGDVEQSAYHRHTADGHWRAFRAFQDRCAALCEPLTPSG